jgi:6-phospho-3-hexuloisomerase
MAGKSPKLTKFPELFDRILEELGSILHQIDLEDAEKLIEGILSSARIFLAGMGRSGLIARAFAMRLMQIGLEVYFVREVTTPAIGKGDLLIVISGSGETGGTHYIASTARSFGARVFLLTAREKSRIGHIANLIFVLPDAPERTLPLRSAFESAVHIFLDAVVMMIMEKKGITQEEMMQKHSNLD